MAAVLPAQPEPMMTTLRSDSLIVSIVAPRRRGALSGQRLEDDERTDVGQSAHIGELDGWPFPAAGFAAYDGEGGHALHGEGEKDQQRHCAGGAEVALQGVLQADVVLARLHAI